MFNFSNVTLIKIEALKSISDNQYCQIYIINILNIIQISGYIVKRVDLSSEKDIIKYISKQNTNKSVIEVVLLVLIAIFITFSCN